MHNHIDFIFDNNTNNLNVTLLRQWESIVVNFSYRGRWKIFFKKIANNSKKKKKYVELLHP